MKHFEATAMFPPEVPLARAFYIDMGPYSLFVATDASDDEMADRFLAWDIDEEEWLWINGWLMDSSVEEDGKDREDPLAEMRAFGLTAQ